MLRIIVFIPNSHLEIVKNAMFEAGAGKYQGYDQCCFQTEGIGQFRPLKGSNPHFGEHEKLEIVKETKVEMICSQEIIENVMVAMKSAHPYEVPAYDVIKREEF